MYQQEPLQEQINSIIALFSSGQVQEALDAVAVLIKDYPNEALLFNISGAFYQAIGQLDESVKSFEKAVTINSDYAEAHYNLGVTLQQLGQFEAAMKSYKQALAIKQAYPNAHNNLGTMLQELGQLDAAVKSYEQAIAIKPDYAEAYNNLGNVLRELGQLDAGVKNLKTALALKPDYISAHHNLSVLKKYTTSDPQIAQMQSLLSKSNLSQSDRTHLCFALAKVNEDLGKQEELFNYLHEANRLRKQELNYSSDRSKTLFSTVKKIFSSAYADIEKSLSSKSSTFKPIFIVGMPRSGSTLVEQIISSHHTVHGAGELTNLPSIIGPIATDHVNQGLNKLPEKAFLSIRAQYLDVLSNLNIPESVITDKLPLNFQFIGFILTAFPEAKIVHLKRDARATCWSIYKHYFISAGNGWAYNLDDLAGFYCLYADLMDFWHQLFPGKFYDMCYEDLTTNQEEETRKLLQYCELDWDDNCLNFHKNKRAVKTASAEQVREKMYQGSSEAWKQYEVHLKPLIKALSAY